VAGFNEVSGQRDGFKVRVRGALFERRNFRQNLRIQFIFNLVQLGFGDEPVGDVINRVKDVLVRNLCGACSLLQARLKARC